MKIYTHGNEITTEELRADVIAAKAKGLSGRFAFFPETVEALLDLLDLYAQQNQDNYEENQKLREANRLQWERLVETEGLVDSLQALIGAQPHHHLCDTQYETNGSCDCWKSLSIKEPKK